MEGIRIDLRIFFDSCVVFFPLQPLIHVYTHYRYRPNDTNKCNGILPFNWFPHSTCRLIATDLNCKYHVNPSSKTYLHKNNYLIFHVWTALNHSVNFIEIRFQYHKKRVNYLTHKKENIKTELINFLITATSKKCFRLHPVQSILDIKQST